MNINKEQVGSFEDAMHRVVCVFFSPAMLLKGFDELNKIAVGPVFDDDDNRKDLSCFDAVLGYFLLTFHTFGELGLINREKIFEKYYTDIMTAEERHVAKFHEGDASKCPTAELLKERLEFVKGALYPSFLSEEAKTIAILFACEIRRQLNNSLQ